MSDEREVETPSGTVVALSRADRKAKLAQILDRGFVSSRLRVDLPDNLHGEWVAKDEVDRLRTYGFKSGEEYVNNSLHNDGTGRAMIGDVMFMVCEKENKEIIDEIYAERIKAKHGKLQGQQEEDRDAVKNATDEDAHITGFSSSKTRNVGVRDIQDALKETS